MAHKKEVIADPAIVVANPDEEVTPETFLAWLDERQQGSPITTSVVMGCPLL